MFLTGSKPSLRLCLFKTRAAVSSWRSCSQCFFKKESVAWNLLKSAWWTTWAPFFQPSIFASSANALKEASGKREPPLLLAREGAPTANSACGSHWASSMTVADIQPPLLWRFSAVSAVNKHWLALLRACVESVSEEGRITENASIGRLVYFVVCYI